jgi:signal transduction histidine kinase/CheY-like chemotaxis protein
VQFIGTLFPFCFAIDRSMRLTMAGPRWAGYASEVAAGAVFGETFVIDRPSGIRTDSDILSHRDDVFILELRSKPEFKLRGQFVSDAASGELLFVGGPWITRIDELARLGLELADFPPHDPRGDFLVLLQAQESTLSDLKDLTARLRAAGAALEVRSREIEREMKLRTELEAQLRQSQKMEAIGRLAGGIAHDFNNILMAVQGYVALSLSRITPNDPVRAWIEEIRKASDRAANLTRQLLAFSRQQVLRPQVLDLAKEIREFEKLLTPLLGERIRLSVRAANGIGFVWADASAINQIVMNLALNARDAMPNGGDLEISLRLREAKPDAPAPTGAGMVELSVRDTGIGMDEATKSRAFEPFFTTKAPGKGSGLGLAQVYGLVEQCGGVIELDTAPGLGSTFRILLPRTEIGTAQVAPEPAASARGGRGERLLLVEDEPLVRKLLEQLLSRAGYQVTSSGDSAEALSIASGSTPFDLLVTDVVMAGHTGPELASRVESVRGKIPTVFISGHTEDEMIRSGALREDQRYLSKPFSPPDLLVKVRELLDAVQPATRRV